YAVIVSGGEYDTMVEDDYSKDLRVLWPNSIIRWSVDSAPGNIHYNTVVDITTKAFQKWEEIIPRWFAQVSNPNEADINILFVNRYHHIAQSDEHFKYGTIAHASRTNPIPYIHINKNVDYVLDDSDGYNLFTVVLHEIGHLLSIPHNKNHFSVMFAYYPINVFQNYSFSSDEIEEARKL
ncbi:matrix metalloproteinase-19-like isoform X2, partial [Leptotrombidium deliense]